MLRSIADRSRFRLVPLFASACALAACGGGGGGGGAAPPPPPASPLTLADCLQDPTGVTSTYLNSSRPRREWKAATFLGQAVTARVEYANATTTVPARAWYYQFNPGAQSVTTVGHEDFNASGAVTLREQFVGLVNSTALAAAQSEAKTYTVKTSVPAGTADRTETSTVTYETNEVITLPGGRLDTCRVKNVLQNSGGTQISVETLHLAKGFGFVKSYYKPTLSTFSDRNQTYVTELVSTTGALALGTSDATTAPTLSQCSALPLNMNVVISASSIAEANSALRTTSVATFNGAPAVAIERRNAASNGRSQINYVEPSVGFLRHVGVDTFDSTGAILLTRVARTGRPNLLASGVLQTTNYTETYTFLAPTTGQTINSADSFTFDGYAKITTPAGTFDTCKVTFTYGSDGSRETYYHAPNLHWVRLDTTLNDGTRTTREMISH